MTHACAAFPNLAECVSDLETRVYDVNSVDHKLNTYKFRDIGGLMDSFQIGHSPKSLLVSIQPAVDTNCKVLPGRYQDGHC